jgi:queuosine precursor transporter
MERIRNAMHKFLLKLKLDKVQATIILCGIYIFFSLAGNIAATKVTHFWWLYTDAGFIYCLTFTWRDLIHKQFGKRAALTTIYTAALINIIAALYFQFVVILPADPSWAAQGGQAAWKFLFGIQLRIVLASILSQLISETADTFTYVIWTRGIGKNKPQWLRVVVSNAVSTPIDSLIFPIIAFAGIVDFTGLVGMFYTGLLIKALTTALSFWMIYLVPEKKIYLRE